MVYSDLIREAAGNRDEVLVISSRIDRVLTRGLETVERLRDFSRQAPAENEAVPADLNALVHEAVEIVRSRLENIELLHELTPVPQVLIRPSDGITAIVNLVLNAVDALQGRGKITIATGIADDGAWVEVADTGPGIPAEIRDRILEPFFTTKGNLGTGLGVPIVYAFTERHGGRLEIRSETGQGATFRMWFPATTSQRSQS
jgi:signal transduction histidine kinase